MKKFIRLTLLLSATIVIISLLAKLLVPPFWGNELIDTKISYLLNDSNPSKYNTVFLGTSRVNNQVNPFFFDKLNNGKTSSYNLGCPGSTMVESIKVAEYLISQNEDMDYMIMELSSIFIPAGDNKQAIQTKYFIGLSEYLFLTKFFAKSNIDFWKRMEQMGSSLKLFIENKLNIGMYGALFNRFREPVEYNVKYQDEKRGYHPLYLNTENRAEKKRRNNFLRNSEILTLRRENALKFSKRNAFPHTNTVLLDRLERLQKQAEEKQIVLLFLLPPRLNMESYKQLLPVVKELEDSSIIRLYDPSKYPQFYNMNYSFDRAHLNAKGSDMLTREISKAFLRHVQL